MNNFPQLDSSHAPAQPFDMDKLLESLSKERPVFHSEADFQHALAWEIKLKNPNASIRLEKQVAGQDRNRRAYLDLLIEDKKLSQHIAIELKYKTRRALIKHEEEMFDLRNQSAQNWGRYGFFNDLARIEQYIVRNPNSEGYVVFLTNAPIYWERGIRNDVYDRAFHINEGCIITKGIHDWHLPVEAVRMDRPAIEIRDSYNITWKEFSQIGEHLFRYAVIHVTQK